MDLLGFARGPALKVALAIFCLGVAWRIAGFALLRIRRDLNKPRASPVKFMTEGLIALVLLFGPHIAFLGSLIGITWPGLPSSLITVISVLTLALFLAVLFRRVTNPVMRMLANFDDYFSWFITMLVMATGIAATAHIGARYETLLAVHILS